MPLGCFGPSSSEKQLRVQLDQASAQLSAKEREIADIKRRHEELSARQSQNQRAASDDLVRSANLLRQQVEGLSTALQAKEQEAIEASDKLKAALAEAEDVRLQLEKERAAGRSAEQLRAAAAAAQAQIAHYEKQFQDSQTHQEALSQELAAARMDAATASSDASIAREEAASVREQFAKVIADQAQAIAEAEERAAAVAQEAAASTVAATTDMAEKAATANRQQLEALRAELQALKAELQAQQVRLQSAEQTAAELPTLRRQAQETQQQLATAQAELASARELRNDLSERLTECQSELEDANLVRQSLEAERRVMAEQLEQLSAERGRLETQVQELEANLLDAVTAAAIAASAAQDVGAAEAAQVEDGLRAAETSSWSAGSSGGAEGALAPLVALGAKTLAEQLVAAQAEASDLRKELERTIVGHVEVEEAVQAENEGLKDKVEKFAAALAAAESRTRELEAAQTLNDQLSSQLDDTQRTLDEARGTVATLRMEIVGLELERAAFRNREDEVRAEVARLQQQLKDAQLRAVELVSANADLQVEQAKLRSEVLSQGLLSDSNTQMATKLLTDYQALKDEHAKLCGEVRRKDEMMALLQEQLSSLTEIDLDSMLRQIDNVQTRKPVKKSGVAAAASMEVMLAAAGLASGKSGTGIAGYTSSASGGASGTPSAPRGAVAAAVSGTGMTTAGVLLE